MPSAVIIINVAGQSPGVPGESRLFDYSVLSPTPPLVSLELQVTTGVTKYFWEFLDVPKNATAVFDDPTSAAPTFTPDAGLTSTYLIQCTVNDGESRGRVAIAFATQRLDVRKLAAGEGPQFDEQKGWVEAYNDFVDKVEGLIIGGNVIGPDPSTLRAIATYGNTSGDLLLNNLLRIDNGLGGPAPASLVYRALQAWNDGTWRNLVELQSIPAGGGELGGNEVVLGCSYLKSSICAIDDPKARGAGGNGKILHEALNSIWDLPQRGGITSKQALSYAVLYLASVGANSGKVDMYVGSVNPNSVVTANPGSVFYRIDGATSAIYQHRGASASNSDWAEVVGGSGGDFSGPASSTQNALVLFGDTSGTVGINSPIRHYGDSDENGIQIYETEAVSPTWRNVVRLVEVTPGTLPGGETVDLGSIANNLLLSSLTDPYIALPGSVYAKLIHESIAAGWTIQNRGIIQTPDGDTTAPLTKGTNPALNGAVTRDFVGSRDPNGAVTGNPGDTYNRTDGTSSRKYQHRGVAASNSDWKDISAVGGTSLGETWTFNSATSGDPGSKHFRFNNATQASATVLAVSDTAENGVNFSSVLLKLSVDDTIYIQQGDDSSGFMLVSVTGPPTDNTTYVSIPITVNSYGTPFQNGKTCPSRYMFSGAGSGSGTANRGFYAYRSGSNQTLPPSGAGYVVGLNAKRDDTDSNFTAGSTTNLFTAPVAGRYSFAASLKVTINHVSGGYARIYLLSSAHGIVSEANVFANVGGKTSIPSLAALLYMDAGETLQLWAFQDSADNAVIEEEYSHFSGAQIVSI